MEVVDTGQRRGIARLMSVAALYGDQPRAQLTSAVTSPRPSMVDTAAAPGENLVVEHAP
jgi:hypothetical protein